MKWNKIVPIKSFDRRLLFFLRGKNLLASFNLFCHSKNCSSHHSMAFTMANPQKQAARFLN